MLHQVIADTGVLVALINRRDVYHSWVTEQAVAFHRSSISDL